MAHPTSIYVLLLSLTCSLLATAQASNDNNFRPIPERVGLGRIRTRHGLPSLAAYYQCYARAAAMNDTLAHFRLAYPNARLYVVNDGGDPRLQLLATYYHSIYVQSTHKNHEGQALLYTAGSAATWLRWITRSVGDADWLLNLEDDVRVLRRVEPTSLQCDVNGDNPDTRLPSEIQELIRRRGGNPGDGHYGGCGGAIFRGNFLRRLQQDDEWIGQLVDIYTAVGGRALGTDIVISSLAYLNNGTICGYDGFAEQWYSDIQDRLSSGQVAVLHQDKVLYEVAFNFSAFSETIQQHVPLAHN